MALVRNSINIVGITSEEELPKNLKGQAILYSETERLFIPKNKPAARSLFEIGIGLDIQSNRLIQTNLGRIMVLDGARNYKVIYTEKDSNNKANFLTMHLPYNTFVELPANFDTIDQLEVYIIDAYFDLIDGRSLYSYMLFLIDISYSKNHTIKTITPEVLTKNVGKIKAINTLVTSGQIPKKPSIKLKSFRKDLVTKNSEEALAVDSNIPLIDLDSEYL